MYKAVLNISELKQGRGSSCLYNFCMSENKLKQEICKNNISACASRLRFVLIAPTHPGNIGGVARAMKTMGLARLAIVQSHCFPDPQATAMAVGATEVLKQAVCPDSLADAVADCHLVIGTSARSRHLRWPLLSPSAAAVKICTLPINQQAAVVFGRESSGLSNKELDLCQYLIRIPGNPDFNSLNLASAVQIIAYEIYRCAVITPPADTAVDDIIDTTAPSAEMERFFIHFETALQQTSFLKTRQAASLMRRLRKLFQRACPTQREINILRGIISALGKNKHKV